MKELLETALYHPYSRYGFAVALFLDSKKPDGSDIANEEELGRVLIYAIQEGLGEFRMQTFDSPDDGNELRYESISLKYLRNNPKLVQSIGLAKQGKYLYPTVLTTDGSAKDTFAKAEDIIKRLKTDKLYSTSDLSRSFAPTTSKINNGKASQSPPKGNLVEIACSVITTITSLKPAAWIEQQNTIIVPDLPLQDLRGFISLFSAMYRAECDDLLKLTLRQQHSDSEDNKGATGARKGKSPDKPEFRRPPIFRGNYPFAPRQAAALGAVGLMGAIGRWARKANMEDKARDVLASIAGTPTTAGRPLYVTSYDSITQVQFTHHIVDLSLKGRLSEILDSLTHRTVLYSEIDKLKRQWDSPAFTNFYMMVSRFLQLFTQPALQDFLAYRAEYPYELHTIFEVYFMEQRKISDEIVHSARAFGQWLNQIAYRVASQEIGKAASRQKLNEAKAKLLILFENIIMSSKTPQEMIGRIASQAGRLFPGDIPPEATVYIDTVNNGTTLKPTDAQYLLLAYLRLRSSGSSTAVQQGENGEEVDQSSEETSATEFK